ncbi:hypothetical protein [Marinobacterium lutimaris]|uniref:Uncharacterized protein n=1 Tax=Marinobacterium lutimaris TaxID=568106 RepID=A0A1H5TKG5_9GAMM|nr:hypothetical protein [Marinobacterium lutimaris]SEF62507.1 hypothetical protein SAMN05444390_10184 [Marinobacterium lutimaris]
MSLVKNLLIMVGVSAGGVYTLGTLIDGLSPPADKKSVQASHEHPKPESEFEHQFNQLMAGADPSDLFEATAAGGARDCLHGRIQMSDGNHSALNGRLYVAHRSSDITYIQTLEPSDTYLVQGPLQAVTANRQTEIPDAAKQALQRDIQHIERCTERSFYLSSINETPPES